VFAVRNLRLGRGDRAGALRIAAVVFAAGVLASALGVRHLPTATEAPYAVSVGVGAALWNAVLVWVLFVAIEPFARRRWPEMLISWSRLMAGRFRDPRVGRDVLLGVAFLWLVFVPLQILLNWDYPGLGNLALLSGSRYFFAELIEGVGSSVSAGLLGLLFVLLFRLVLRRQWAAVGGVVALGLLYLYVGYPPLRTEDVIAVLSSGALIVAQLLLIMRVGLLAFVVTMFLDGPFYNDVPVTLELSAWYGEPTLLFLLVVAILTFYGFYVSLGGRPMFGEKFLEE
jgi:hypothetical protein